MEHVEFENNGFLIRGKRLKSNRGREIRECVVDGDKERDSGTTLVRFKFLVSVNFNS